MQLHGSHSKTSRVFFGVTSMYKFCRSCEVFWVASAITAVLWLTKWLFGIKYTPLAEVAELADALRSGRSEHTLMRVQIPPSAHGKPAERRVFVFLWALSAVVKIEG